MTFVRTERARRGANAASFACQQVEKLRLKSPRFHNAMTTAHLGVALARTGYPRFAAELVELHATLAQFCSTPDKAGGVPPRCMSCTLELELTYMRVRMAKPRVMWEISPLHGFTTIMLLTALHRNNNSAHLHSFDRHAGAKVYVTRSKYPRLMRHWTFHELDLMSTVRHAAQVHGNQGHAVLKALAPRPNCVCCPRASHGHARGCGHERTHCRVGLSRVCPLCHSLHCSHALAASCIAHRRCVPRLVPLCSVWCSLRGHVAACATALPHICLAACATATS